MSHRPGGPSQARTTGGPLARTVYERLKGEITALTFAPGTPLQELELGSRYGVSRTPVREALRRLLLEGLVQRTGRLFRVSKLSATDIQDLYEFREALETAAVRLCIERASEEAMEELAQLVRRSLAALERADAAAFIRLDSAFHLRIAAETCNQALLRQLTVVHDRVRLARDLETARPGWLERAVVEHGRILSALQRRDTAIAEAEMRFHIRSVVRLHLGLPQLPPTIGPHTPFASKRERQAS